MGSSLSAINKKDLLGTVLPPKQLSTIRVAKATNERGQLVCSVSYTKIETFFLITGFSVSPFASVEEAQIAGDVIDKRLEREAFVLGISALHILLPGQDRCEEVRTYTRKSSQDATALMNVGCFDTAPSPKYLN